MPISAGKWIEDYVKSKLGHQIVSIIDRETDSYEVALQSAAYRYWVAFPYTRPTTVTVSISPGSYNQSVDALLEQIIPDTVLRQEAYFLGILKYFEATQGLSVRSLDAYLIGQPVNDLYRKHGAPLPIDKMILNQTESDISLGELEYRYDAVNKVVQMLFPSYFAQVSIFWGFGFSHEKTLDLVENAHWLYLALFTLEEYLDQIITARSIIEVDGDFRLNVDGLKDTREWVREKIQTTVIPAIEFTMDMG